MNLEAALDLLRRSGQTAPLTKSEPELIQFIVDGLVELTTIDPLTGLGNRRKMEEETVRALSRRKRGHPSTLLAVDIDDFKRINDANNHLVGDEILRQTARLLRRCLRDNDVAIRMGGDEFAVILSDTDAAVGELVAKRISEAISSEYFTNAGLHVTASIGLAELTYGDTSESWWTRADLQMFESKKNGKNLVTAPK